MTKCAVSLDSVLVCNNSSLPLSIGDAWKMDVGLKSF